MLDDPGELSVLLEISEPWEFAAHNPSASGIAGKMVARTKKGHWLVRLAAPLQYKGEFWNYAIVSTRHEGQGQFDEKNADTSANILFVHDSQAESPAWLEQFSRYKKPDTPWTIGSISVTT